MRGLVVVAVALLLASLSSLGMAESSKTEAPTVPAELHCYHDKGTVVVLKAHLPLQDVKVEKLCEKDQLRRGWTMSCYTEKLLDSVSVTFRSEGGQERATIPCS